MGNIISEKMAIEITCSKCKHQWTARTSIEGKTYILCPRCRYQMRMIPKNSNVSELIGRILIAVRSILNEYPVEEVDEAFSKFMDETFPEKDVK